MNKEKLIYEIEDNIIPQLNKLDLSYKDKISILLAMVSKVTKSIILDNLEMDYRNKVMNEFNSCMLSLLKDLYTDEQILLVLGKMGEILLRNKPELEEYLISDFKKNNPLTS